jgi:hypothetical protein
MKLGKTFGIRRLAFRAGGRAWLTATAFLAVSLAAACTVKESEQYVVQLGDRAVYGHIFQKPTQQILQVHYQHCRGDVNCTANFLRNNVKLSGRGAAEWNQALRDDRGTLKSSIERIRAGQGKCLVIKKDIVPPNFGNTNFEVSSRPEWCKVGQAFAP